MSTRIYQNRLLRAGLVLSAIGSFAACSISLPTKTRGGSSTSGTSTDGTSGKSEGSELLEINSLEDQLKTAGIEFSSWTETQNGNSKQVVQSKTKVKWIEYNPLDLSELDEITKAGLLLDQYKRATGRVVIQRPKGMPSSTQNMIALKFGSAFKLSDFLSVRVKIDKIAKKEESLKKLGVNFNHDQTSNDYKYVTKTRVLIPQTWVESENLSSDSLTTVRQAMVLLNEMHEEAQTLTDSIDWNGMKSYAIAQVVEGRRDYSQKTASFLTVRVGDDVLQMTALSSEIEGLGLYLKEASSGHFFSQRSSKFSYSLPKTGLKAWRLNEEQKSNLIATLSKLGRYQGIAKAKLAKFKDDSLTLEFNGNFGDDLKKKLEAAKEAIAFVGYRIKENRTLEIEDRLRDDFKISFEIIGDKMQSLTPDYTKMSLEDRYKIRDLMSELADGLDALSKMDAGFTTVRDHDWLTTEAGLIREQLLSKLI